MEAEDLLVDDPRDAAYCLPRAEAVRQRVQTADPNTRLRWSEWVLTATGLEDVLAEAVKWETPIRGVHDSVVRPLFLPGQATPLHCRENRWSEDRGKPWSVPGFAVPGFARGTP